MAQLIKPITADDLLALRDRIFKAINAADDGDWTQSQYPEYLTLDSVDEIAAIVMAEVNGFIQGKLIKEI